MQKRLWEAAFLGGSPDDRGPGTDTCQQHGISAARTSRGDSSHHWRGAAGAETGSEGKSDGALRSQWGVWRLSPSPAGLSAAAASAQCPGWSHVFSGSPTSAVVYGPRPPMTCEKTLVQTPTHASLADRFSFHSTKSQVTSFRCGAVARLTIHTLGHKI